MLFRTIRAMDPVPFFFWQRPDSSRRKDGVEFRAITDITENPKNYQIVELDAAQLPRSLDDVDLAAVNTNYALEAGLNPVADSLFREDKDSPFAAVLVVREQDADNPTYKKIVQIYQSEPIKKFMEEKIQGSGHSGILNSIDTRPPYLVYSHL